MKPQASCILCFLHEDMRRFAGGLAKYIREEQALAAERGLELVTAFPLHIRQSPRLAVWASRGWGVRRGDRWEGMYGWNGLARMVARWQREGTLLSEIQLHHIAGFDAESLRRFLAAVPAGVRLFLHDYSTVCPSPHLMRNGREHCGPAAPCEAKCRGCRSWNPAWRSRMESVLGGLGRRLRIVAPSASVAEGWSASWPAFRGRIEVVPHWLPVRTVRGPGRAPGRRLKLAFAGAQLPHKGWDVWCRVAKELGGGDSPFECLYFGLGRSVPGGMRAVEAGEGGMTEALRREGVDFLCLWSVWPETYSYVYHEAVQAGAWVLAPEVSGNVADSIRKSGWGTVFRDEAELLAFLRDGTRVRATLDRARETERPAEMSVNPRVLDTLPEPRALPLPGGRAHRAWLHEAVWKLKEWTGHA